MASLHMILWWVADLLVLFIVGNAAVYGNKILVLRSIVAVFA